MQFGKCDKCGLQHPLKELRAVTVGLQQFVRCDLCISEIATAGQVAQLVDPTVCSRCQLDNGSAELPTSSGIPFCPSCLEVMRNRPYPQWLQLSFYGLLVLLVAGLVHERRYFAVERDLIRAERLVVKKKYGEAIPLLAEALRIAPSSQKVILLAAKAYLLNGQPQQGIEVTGGRKDYDDNDAYKEVASILKRVDKALEQAEKADQLGKDGNEAEALKLMQEAANLYPEQPQLAVNVDVLSAAVAFDAKDYDRFLALSEKTANRASSDPNGAALLASALACKYAVTSDAAFRERAEQALDRARILSKSTEQQAEFKEYAERIEYRLRTKVIIDKKEYDRRFRSRGKKEGE